MQVHCLAVVTGVRECKMNCGVSCLHCEIGVQNSRPKREEEKGVFRAVQLAKASGDLSQRD